MTEATDIVFIGQSPIDIIAEVDDAFLEDLGLLKSCSNDITREQVDAIGRTLTNSSIHPGGAAANSAACYGALGGAAVFNGKIADDAMGRLFYESFAPFNVRIPGLPKSHAAGSDLIYVLVTPDRERTFAAYYGINSAIEAADLDSACVRSARMTYLEAYLMRAQGGSATLLDMAVLAKKSGRQVALSPSDVKIVRAHRDEIMGLLAIADIFIANMSEARELFGTDDLDSVIRSLRAPSPLLIVTDGANGVRIADSSGTAHVPAPALQGMNIVNTNGAGDHFAAGFLYAHLKGMPHEKAGLLGNIYACRALAQESARPSSLCHGLLEEVFPS